MAGRGLDKLLAALAAGSAALTITACGGAKTRTVTVHVKTSKGAQAASLTASQLKSPTAILTAAGQAISAAKTVHLQGTGLSGQTGVGLNISIVNNRGFAGTVTENRYVLHLIVIGPETYMKASQAYWQMTFNRLGHSGSEVRTLSRALAARWIGIPTSSTNGEFAKLFDLRKLFSQTTQDQGKLVRESDTTFDGQSVLVIRDTTKGGSAYIAATGQPYPLKITSSGSDSGTITFSNFNAPVRLTAPANVLRLKSGVSSTPIADHAVARRASGSLA